jgi:HSP20 family protein
MGALIRYGTPLRTLSDVIEDFLNENHFSLSDRDISRKTWPAVDIVEEDDAYRLRADLPGLRKENINVAVENGQLTISGTRNGEAEERKEGHFYHFERSYGSFSRSFNLPDNIDAGRITAHYRDGTLELELKKRPESKPRSIDVKIN